MCEFQGSLKSTTMKKNLTLIAMKWNFKLFGQEHNFTNWHFQLTVVPLWKPIPTRTDFPWASISGKDLNLSVLYWRVCVCTFGTYYFNNIRSTWFQKNTTMYYSVSLYFFLKCFVSLFVCLFVRSFVRLFVRAVGRSVGRSVGRPSVGRSVGRSGG